MAKQVTDPGNGVEPESVKRFKPRLAFSIDSILGRSDETALNQTSVGREATRVFAPVDSRSVSRLPWLSYTRYSPPKLPRSRRKLKNCKRRSSGSPRVPFSSTQLMTLEQTYTENRYLSGTQVAKLSTSLNLPHHRIKIWFQNRRAREKRSKEETSVCSVSEESPPSQQPHGGFKLDTPLCGPFSLSLSMNCFALGNYTSRYNMLGGCVNFDTYSCGKMGC